MLFEYRKLIFPKEDLIEAINNHDRETRAHCLPGSVQSLKIIDDQGIYIEVSGAEGGDRHPVTLGEDFVLAAMVRYCISNQIPVAQKAEKRVEVEDGQLALSMSIDQQTTGTAGQEYYILL